jgi:hypothetical protein
MARARNIKPGLFKNEVLGVADPLYTLLFEGLWLLADRAGRLEDRPLRIKAEVFPYRDGIDMTSMLDWLQRSGFVLRYRVAGSAYIQILSFEKHQNPHKNEPESVIPSMESADATSEEIGSSTEVVPKESVALGLIPDSGFRIPDNASAATPPPPAGKPAPFDPLKARLPEWLQPQHWAMWVKHRKSIGKRIKTQDTVVGLIAALERFRAEGLDPEQVIVHNIASGNQGLFPPPRIRGAGPQMVGPSDADKTADYLEQQKLPPLSAEQRKANADRLRAARAAIGRIAQ